MREGEGEGESEGEGEGEGEGHLFAAVAGDSSLPPRQADGRSTFGASRLALGLAQQCATGSCSAEIE